VLIAGGVDAPSRARRLIKDWLAAFLTPEQLRDAVLMASEVVTNAFVHGGADAAAPMRVEVAIRPGAVRVLVADPASSGAMPVVKGPGIEAVGGLGLFIVDQLSARWGCSRGGETAVWFEVETG
jgi:anti-sigma regulatory factor (Ser/Thr protein kinase)